MNPLHNDWAPLLEPTFQSQTFLQLREFLKHEYANQRIYPGMNDIFNALHYTPYHNAKIVILGQDPYHGPGQAHGFSFSVQPGVKIPPSLRNIYKELHEDVDMEIPNHGNLLHWAKQGVILLNTVLTVREKNAHSHKGMGWEVFTDEVIRLLNEREDPLVFMLWGKHAQQKREMLNESKHLILTSPHPSPFSAHKGFFGSKHFSRANAFLVENGFDPIHWQLPLKADEL